MASVQDPPPASTGSVSVIMPAFNEAPFIGECLERVLRQPCVGEVIVIDDGSTDATASIVAGILAHDPRLRFHRHPSNAGKGAGLRTGLACATGRIVIIQDADIEYDPEDYEALLRPLLQGRADAVFGSRFLGGGPHRVLYFWHFLGNTLITLLSNCFTGLNLSDIECGLKAVSRAVASRLTIEESRFGVEPELVAKIAAMKVRAYEVPVSYHGRTYAEGKKVGWRDGIHALWCIVKYGITTRW
jgi:glycosyltransferase involved in cell wall biosynthesis